ncbi:hypothetical protein FRC09_011083 [Ceratobasidium sp. 395]|nr:hypothetical protein FRC09_011083 [Ceratobasidium sp. 395]
MQFSNTFVALYAIALAGYAAAQGMTVATPASVVQCQPVQLSWSGGAAPYFLSIIPGKQPGAAALKELPQQQGTSYTWTVDLPQGTSITVQIRDSTGFTQYSSDVVIQNSSDSSCLNGNTSAPAPAPTSTAGGSSSPNAPAPSNTAPNSSASTSRSSASATSAAPSASASPNAASSVTTGAFGVAAFAGLLGAALF